MTLRHILAASTVLVGMSALPALAEETIYDVKVVCGKGDGKVVAPGLYWTAINILNPNRETVRLRARVATALPGLQMGPLSGAEDAELRPDRALEIDCPTLIKLAEGPDFLKGYAIVEGSAPLTVVAVYTQADKEGRATSIDIEAVSPRAGAGCPDLAVKEILRPQWDAAQRRSVIRAVIQNIGSADAPSTLARLIDPSTTQPTGAPYNDVQSTGPIPAGGEAMVTFSLPYWVYNPDAELEVTADYKGQLPECNEDNNTAEFSEIG